MINAICNKIVDTLIANPTLLCAGHSSCYASGWPGLTRARTNEAWSNAGVPQPSVAAPTMGYINIFDKPYSKATEESRPGIYIGVETHEWGVSDDGRQVSSGHQIVNRNLDIPLVLTVSHVDEYIARDMRNQLRDNVLKVILANIIKAGAWWSLLAPGEAGGGNLAEHAWITGTAQNSSGRYEAFSVIPVRAKFSFTGSTIP